MDSNPGKKRPSKENLPNAELGGNNVPTNAESGENNVRPNAQLGETNVPSADIIPTNDRPNENTHPPTNYDLVLVGESGNDLDEGVFLIPTSSDLKGTDSDEKNDESGKSESDRNESADEGLSDAASNSSSGSHSKSKKSNRCKVCRKKVGLTGFVCRCGGLFCSLHRYSDKHDCTFNYREMGAEEIRKNNPVVLGEKIHKI